MTLKLNGTNSVAAPAYAGDDADTGLQCGTNELKLVTGGSARATVDSSGNLGIGTTSPTFTSGGGVHNKGESNAFTSFRASVNANTGIDFAAASDGKGYIYNRDNADLIFGTNNTERMRILSDGTIRLASGCPGIDFSQIQTNASGMSSETLDSYEEGTFTIGFTQTSATITAHSSYDTMSYTKIGRICHIFGHIRVSTVSGSGSGNMKITGLPFQIKSGLGLGRAGLHVTYLDISDTFASSLKSVPFQFDEGTTNLEFEQQRFSSISTYGNGDELMISATYLID